MGEATGASAEIGVVWPLFGLQLPQVARGGRALQPPVLYYTLVQVSSRSLRSMLAIVLGLAPISSGYVLSSAVSRVTPAPQPSATCHINVAMGMFDGLAGAFANDDSLGAQKSAGLSTPAR